MSPNPLAMVIRVDHLELEFAEPVALDGQVLTTRIHGAYDTVCAQAGLELLRAWNSTTQKWTFGTPLTLFPRLDSANPRRVFLEQVVFGTRAQRDVDGLFAALPMLAIDIDDQPVSLARRPIVRSTEKCSLAEHVAGFAASAAPGCTALVVDLLRPFATNGKSFSLASALDGIALWLCRFDLEDRGIAEELGEIQCKLQSESIAQQARRSLDGLDERVAVRHVYVDERRSASNGNKFHLDGYEGQVLLQGDPVQLQGALPWLVGLALRGGRHRKFDMSAVGLRWRKPVV